MTPIFKFDASLRLFADDEEDARERARALADAVSRGDATLALDSSAPAAQVKSVDDPD